MSINKGVWCTCVSCWVSNESVPAVFRSTAGGCCALACADIADLDGANEAMSPNFAPYLYSSPGKTLRSNEQYRSVGSAIANIGDIISLRSHCEQAFMSRVKLISPVKLYKAFVALVAVSTCKNGYRSSSSAAFIV